MSIPPKEQEKLISGLLVWNRTKAANYLNCTANALRDLCKEHRIIPDIITHWHCRQIYWFTKQTLDVYLMDQQEELE